MNIKFRYTGLLAMMMTLAVACQEYELEDPNEKPDIENPDPENPDPENPDPEIPEGGSFEYTTSFNDAAHDVQYNSDGWSSTTIKGNMAWVGKEYKGNLTISANAYKGEAGEHQMNLLSPEFNLDECKQKCFSFVSAQAFYNETTTLEIFVVQGEQNTRIEGITLAANDTHYEAFSTGDIDLTAFAGKVRILFQYTAQGGKCTNWTIDDFLFGNSVDGDLGGGGNPDTGNPDGGGENGGNEGATGIAEAAALKTYYHNQIDGHKSCSYGDLWEHFKVTDVRPDGYINDIYDDKTNFRPGTDQGGNTDDYNREHSVPKSWYNDKSPQYTDLYHLYPSSVTANSRRGNDPFGEVEGSASWTNGYCQSGNMNIPGYGSTRVFEPNDKVKGNLARTYFYFATRYEDENATASAGHYMFDNNSYPYFKEWAIEMLLEWHRMDPVDDLERKRNQEIQKIQGNTNPFIDDEDLAEYIWGTKMGEPYQP